MNTKKIFQVFLDDYKEIVSKGRISKLSEYKIEVLQEAYLENVIYCLIKGSGMSDISKLVILDRIVSKVKKES